MINVSCRKNPSWQVRITQFFRSLSHSLSVSLPYPVPVPQIKRRYSQFVKFHKILCRLHPSISSLSFPPKIFFKMSIDVASTRRILLGQYLISVIDSCTTYDTPEQELIFKFLGVYDHIIHDILDGSHYSHDWNPPGTLPFQLIHTATSTSNSTTTLGHAPSSSSSPTPESTTTPSSSSSSSSSQLLKTSPSNMNWSTAPFAAVFISACMIVISFMGQIIK